MTADLALDWAYIMEHATELTDEQREAAIKVQGDKLLEAIREGVKPDADYFTQRAIADCAREKMEALIKGRSPEMVARLERERGLAA